MEETQREPIINFSHIERFSSYGEIDGKILTTFVSENETLFILTDHSCLYFQEQGKEKKKFFLIPTISIDQDKYQSEENNSLIWSDKFGYHTLIYNDKRVYYFNPSFEDGPKEIELLKEKYLEPLALAFNNNIILSPNNRNFVEVLFSDYYSDIYSLTIKIENGNPKVSINLLYKLRNEDEEDIFQKDDNYEFSDFN